MLYLLGHNYLNKDNENLQGKTSTSFRAIWLVQFNYIYGLTRSDRIKKISQNVT